MVAVPDAIQTVLEQTAMVLEESNETSGDGRSSSRTVSICSPGTVLSSQLLGHTLHQDILMPEPGYPNYRASIMDGYAIRTSDHFTLSSGDASVEPTHHILDKVYAGDEDLSRKQTEGGDADSLPPAYYITTGAVVPDSFDCVVPIEECVVLDEGKLLSIQTSADISPKKWIRDVGCDTPAGSVVLPKGKTIDSASLGLLLQCGVQQVELKASIKVGVLSTGNELLGGDTPTTTTISSSFAGQIPDVNRPMLLSLLSTLGPWCVPVDLGIRRDDNVELLVNTLRNALTECDVIISTGGISKGETDVMEQVLIDELGGKLHFGRLHMKPGKPTTFVTIETPARTRLFFAMPGNPVSAVVCTHLLVKPCLHLLYHGPDTTLDTHGESSSDMVHRIVSNAWVHPEVTAKLKNDTKLDKERPEYHRVVLSLNEQNEYIAESTGVQRSSRLMSMRDAQGLLVLPQGVVGGKMMAYKGEEYTVLLLHDDPVRRVQVHSSLHLNQKVHKPFPIGVVYVVHPEHQTVNDEVVLAGLSERIRTALSGSKSGPATISSARYFSGKPEHLFDFVKQEEHADVIVVACAPGSFRRDLDVSAQLRRRLDKIGDALALQVRRAAASETSEAALFECVVGYVPHGRGAMVVCLSEAGMEGGLSNVRGLLKHALQVARPTSRGASLDHKHR
jgi:molybdopterin molybdotransferase